MTTEAYNQTGCLKYFIYCENGDFGTDYTTPSKALAEVESAYKWNSESKLNTFQNGKS